MQVDPLFDGWWLAQGGQDVTPYVRQVKTGDEYNIEMTRGLQPTRERAESFLYHDMVPSYWEYGLAVYADHCLGCGWFAKVLAGDNTSGWVWRVTECKRCGVIDSRSMAQLGSAHRSGR